MHNRIFSAVAASALAAVLSVAWLTVPTSAALAATDEDTVTWSVTPVQDEAAAPRAWVELELDPGESAEDAMVIRNLSDEPVTFSLTAADGYFTDRGRFTMLPTGTESTDAGLWISIPETVDVPAGESVEVPFTVTVPEDATPGDHPAGVAAGILSVGSDDKGKAIGVDSRVGFRVMTRVTGELAPAVAVSIDAATYQGSWNPFEPGSVSIDYTVKNTGNTRLSVDTELTLSAPFGGTLGEVPGELIEEIAPGETRSGTATFRSTWPLGMLTGAVSANATPLAIDGTEMEQTVSDTATVAIPAIPWSQLAVLVLIGLLLLAYQRERIRQRRALDRAREQGRVEALTAAGRSGDEH